MRMKLTPLDDNALASPTLEFPMGVNTCKENKGKQRSKGYSGKSFFFLKPEPCCIKWPRVCVLVNFNDIY